MIPKDLYFKVAQNPKLTLALDALLLFIEIQRQNFCPIFIWDFTKVLLIYFGFWNEITESPILKYDLSPNNRKIRPIKLVQIVL